MVKYSQTINSRYLHATRDVSKFSLLAEGILNLYTCFCIVNCAGMFLVMCVNIVIQWLLQAGCKFLIFAHHKPMIDSIYQFLLVRPLTILLNFSHDWSILTRTAKIPEKESGLHSNWWQHPCSIKASFGYRFSGERCYQGSSSMAICFIYFYNLLNIFSIDLLFTCNLVLKL